MKNDTRKIFLLIAAICGLPIVLSYLAYYVWRPDGTMNYGELISPPAPLAGSLTALDGTRFTPGTLRGKWVLVHANKAACDDNCRQLMYYMRQARAAQGMERERIERLWIITDDGTPDANWLKEYPGMKIVRGQPALPATDASRHLYLVDPFGNVILRYPEHPVPKRIIKDLERLMKYSNQDRGAK